jgi:hypothetical protein
MTDYNIKAQLELIDKQAKLLDQLIQPTIVVTHRTLRDQFAMAALSGIEFNYEMWGEPKERAERAYALADAMMEARK